MLNRLFLLVFFLGGCATPQSESSDATSDQPDLPGLTKNERRLGDSLPGVLARKPLKEEVAGVASKQGEIPSVDPGAKPSVENEPPIEERASSKQEEALKERPSLLGGTTSEGSSKRELSEPEALEELSGKEEIEPTEDNEAADGESPPANKPSAPSAEAERQQSKGEAAPPIKNPEAPALKIGAPSSLQEKVTTDSIEEKRIHAPEEPSSAPTPQSDSLIGEIPSRDAPSPPADETQRSQGQKEDSVAPSSKEDPIEGADNVLPESTKAAKTETNKKEDAHVGPSRDAPSPPAEESHRLQVQREESVAPSSKEDSIEEADHALPEAAKEPITETNKKEDFPVTPEAPDLSPRPAGSVEAPAEEKTFKEASIGSVPIDHEHAGQRPRIFFNRPEPTKPSEGGRGLRPRFVFRKPDASSFTGGQNPRARLSFAKNTGSADSSEVDARSPTWSSLLRPSTNASYDLSNHSSASIADEYGERNRLWLDWSLPTSNEANPQPVTGDHGVKWQLRDPQEDNLLANAQYMSSESYTETIRWLKWKPRPRDFEILDLDLASGFKTDNPSTIRWLKWKPRTRDFEILDLPASPSREYSKTVKWLSGNREP